MKISCRFCKQELELSDGIAVGQCVRCSHCGRTFGYGIGVKRPSRIELPTDPESLTPRQPERSVVSVSCPSCYTQYEVTRDEIGQEAQCEVCGANFTVGQRARTRLEQNKLPTPSLANRKKTLIICIGGAVGAFVFFTVIVGLVALLLLPSGSESLAVSDATGSRHETVVSVVARADQPEGEVWPTHEEPKLIEDSRTSVPEQATDDTQTMREVNDARSSMKNGEYGEALRHYGLAIKLLNDSPSSGMLRNESRQGIAESLYRMALHEDDLGHRDQAQELMEKALEMQHPKAKGVLERWQADSP